MGDEPTFAEIKDFQTVMRAAANMKDAGGKLVSSVQATETYIVGDDEYIHNDDFAKEFKANYSEGGYRAGIFKDLSELAKITAKMGTDVDAAAKKYMQTELSNAFSFNQLLDT